MIKRLQYKSVTLAVLALLPITSLASEQSANLERQQDYSIALLEKSKSGESGAIEVATILAGCHGFLTELHSFQTRRVKIALKDIIMNEATARDGQRAGYAAIYIMFNHVERPDVYVDQISQSARVLWREEISKMPDSLNHTDHRALKTLEKLLECKQAAPLSNYLFQASLKENGMR